MSKSSSKQVVRIVDDDENARQSVSLVVEDAGFVPVPMPGPLGSLLDFMKSLNSSQDWVIFDHKLNLGTYAGFVGAQAVASLYGTVPSLLSTAWSLADMDAMRAFRRKIPVLIKSGDLDSDSILRGFEICTREFKGEFSPFRAPTQAIVRIEEVDNEQKPPIVKAILPGWSHKEVVRFPIDIIPSNLWTHVLPSSRFLAKVNLGAEEQSELYLDEFEFRP